jgi:histidinol phosphatase-like enzyme
MQKQGIITELPTFAVHLAVYEELQLVLIAVGRKLICIHWNESDCAARKPEIYIITLLER